MTRHPFEFDNRNVEHKNIQNALDVILSGPVLGIHAANT